MKCEKFRELRECRTNEVDRDEARHFWKQVVNSAVTNGQHLDHAVWMADHVLNMYVQRVKSGRLNGD